MVGWPISTIFYYKRLSKTSQPTTTATIAEDDNRLGRWVVCSAWPYVNDRPHLGTFTHLLSADVYARYLRLKGEDVVMVSGSDEHGAPIEVEAIKRKITPRQLTNQYHRVFTRSIKSFNIVRVTSGSSQTGSWRESVPTATISRPVGTSVITVAEYSTRRT